MKNYIVCTSINPPTSAIKKFDRMKDWTLIVVGDKKTPEDYKLQNGIYLSPGEQESISKELSELIGWNCIQRRNFGFLLALKENAEIICTVDDDNIPLINWGKNIFVNKLAKIEEYEVLDPAFDPIGLTNHKSLWHRGFPLELISTRNYEKHSAIEIVPDVQADFWNGDPDIDAICRLEHRPACEFEAKYFPFSSNKISPFNSQNTFMNRKAALDYFLFPYVGRMDDIWASYYLQALGHKVIYGAPSVFQARNEHNLISDMKKEYIGYENNLEIVQNIMDNPSVILNYLPKSSVDAWNTYRDLLQ